MICPACDRDNDSRRRYCGKCGHNFRPCCRRCAFANDGGDRFCGGCGANLIASEGVALKKAAPPPPPPVRGDETEVAVVTLRPAQPAQARTPVTAAKPVPVPPAAPPEFPMPSADELAGLFASTMVPSNDKALPQNGVSQDDVDRLFGATR